MPGPRARRFPAGRIAASSLFVRVVTLDRPGNPVAVVCLGPVFQVVFPDGSGKCGVGLPERGPGGFRDLFGRLVLVTREERARELERLLAAAAFARSPKLTRLLQYLVEADREGLKEVVIAGEVYGKGHDYDPAVDSLVRVEVARLRSKLKAHYEGEGCDWAWRLEIARGSYAPVWRRVQPEAKPPRKWPKRVLAGTAAVALAAGVIWGWQEWMVRREVSRAEALLPPSRDLFLQSARERAPRPLDSLLEAAAGYERALRFRPARADIWEGLARTCWHAGDYDRRLYAKAEMAAKRALELDPRRPEAEFYLAHIAFFQRGKAEEAYGRILRAIWLSPDTESFYRYAGDWSAILGKADKGLKLVEDGLKRRPGSEVLRLARLHLLARMGRWNEVESGARQLRGDLATGHRVLAQALMEMGRLEEAESEYGRCVALVEIDEPCWIGLGRVKARRGDRKGAGEVVERLRQIPMHAVAVAMVKAEMGDKQGAMEWLRRAEAEKDDALLYVLAGPGIGALAGEAEYRAMAASLASH